MGGSMTRLFASMNCRQEVKMLESVEVNRLEALPSRTFDCGRPMQNSFFCERSYNDQEDRLSTTYTFEVHGITAAFATICMDSIPLSRSERGRTIPYSWISALKLVQLGVDHRFQSAGLGRWAVAYVVDLANELGVHVGCRYVTLDAQPELEAWYTDQGFVRNHLRQEQRIDDAITHRRDLASLPVSMRYDLRRTA